MRTTKLLLDKSVSRNTFAQSVTRKTFAHDAFPTRHKTGAFCVPEDGGIHRPAGMTRAERSFARMKPLFHLGNGAWCRLVGNFAIGVGLIAGGTPAFSAELSSHAYPPLLSAGAAGDSSTPLVSDDGRFVVFVSAAENLTVNDGNHFMDVFLRDREAHTTILLSTNEAGVSTRLGHSGEPSMSADGNLVSYTTEQRGRDLFFSSPVVSVTNTVGYLIDRTSYSRRRIGIAEGIQLERILMDPPSTNWITYSNNAVGDTHVARNGKRVFFQVPDLPFYSSLAQYSQLQLLVSLDLESGHTNEFCHVLPGELAPNDELRDLHFSESGNRVAFDSRANNLNSLKHVSGPLAVYVYDQVANSNILVSLSADGSAAASGESDSPDISSDGRYVVFASSSTNLVGTDTNLNSDVFLRDLEAGTTVLVSSNLDGVTTSSSGNSDAPAISRDGRWIAFFSNASDLVADDTNGATGDVFLRDNQTGVVTLISSHPEWHGRLASGAQAPQITSDGSFVLYQAPGSGLFLYDRSAGTSMRLTDDVTADSPSMSSDGRFVVFSSQTIPGSIGGTDAHRQIYLYDRELNSFELISRRDTDLPLAASNDSTRFEAGVVATADNLLLSRSYATDLGLRASDGQLRLWNLANTGVRFSEDLGEIDGVAVEAAKAIHLNASADGRWLVFDYDEPALAPVEHNWGWLVVLHDRLTGENRVVNQTNNEFNGPHYPAIAPDASVVLWRSSEGELTLFDTNSKSVTYFHSASLVYQGAGEAPIFSPDSRYAYFRARGFLYDLSSDLIPNFRLIRLDTSNHGLTHIDALDLNSGSANVGQFRLSPNGAFAVYEILDPTNGTNVFLNTLPNVANSLVASNAFNPYVDNSGNWIAFDSTMSVSLVTDTNNTSDVFIKNQASGEVSLVSVNRAGTGTGNGRSKLLGISPDGRFVLFHSWASDLVANDTNQLGDLFLRDLRTQTTLMLTVGLNLAAADGNTSARAMFDRAGDKVIFESYAPNLVAGDFNETRDVYTATLSLPDSDGDGLPDSWELTWFGTLARDGSGDFDNDGVSDHDEFVAGTNPTNDHSVLEALTVYASSSSEPQILWSAIPGRTYRVQYKDDFNVAGWTNLPGDVRATSSTGMRLDDSGTAGEKRFYRVLILP
ncbi:hypothetical protein GC207_11985 [bacterium]|nr:hypothetical protein [bacterium]